MNRSPPRSNRSPPRVHRSTSLLPSLSSSSTVPSIASTTNNSEQNSSSNNSHVRVIARIRPMNHEEAKSSRVCLYAEKPESTATTSNAPPPVLRSTPTSSSIATAATGVVGSLLGRLALTSPTPQITMGLAGGGSFDHDDLDEGMILDHSKETPSRTQQQQQKPSMLLSPHYSSSPMRTVFNSKVVVVDAPNISRRFCLDQVLPPTATQQDVYGSVGDVRAVFRGYNVTILAYGQTAAGKTYTMMGSDSDGVIPLAIHDLMEQKPPQHVIIKLSCLEIYQDDLRDLLVESGPSSRASLSSVSSGAALTLRDASKGNGGVQVRGLTSIKVESVADVLSLLKQSQERRRTGSTRLNERSSRSHMITTLTVANASVNPPVTAKLTLVDLAGSERTKETQVVGASLGESIHINTDLFTLGKVVNALCEKSAHVPYRDSKLTRLLKDALGGNCSTTLICCVSPSELYLEESVNTLRYAERSRSITNSLEQNVVTKSNSPYVMAELRAENQRLRKEVQQLQKMLQGPNVQSLLDKMQQAKELSGEARENSQLVSQQADKWREQLELAKQQQQHNEHFNKVSSAEAESPLAYEMSLAGAFDEDSLVDSDDDSSMLSLDTNTKTKSVQVEIKALAKEKSALKDVLLELSNQIESKREDLEQLEDDYNHRRQKLDEEQERQEHLRDELSMEVSQLKLKLHVLATDNLRGDEQSTGLLGLLRRVSAEGDSSDIDNRTMKSKESQSMTLARELAKSLAEERTRGEELEIKCHELQQKSEHIQAMNDALVNRNRALEEEMRRIRSQLKGLEGKITPSTASPTSRDELDDTGEPQDQASVRDGPHNELVRNKATEILRLAELARTNSTGTCGSLASSIGTELGLGYENDSPDAGNASKFFISNIQDANKCTCETSMFASNAEHVEFYLPILDVSCTCGKQSRIASANPCALESILRPWQVAFLKSVGITDAVEFVHAFTQRGVLLASQMRKWRRQNGMMSVKTKSCRVALHIWHRTCKSVIRHVRQQQAQGVAHPQRPEFLEITVSDHASVSTLGGGSAYNANHQQELLTFE